MTKGILDTSIVIDILNGYTPTQAWYRQIHEPIAITPVVYYEVMSGAYNKFHMQQLMKFLVAFPMEYSDSNDQDWGMNIFPALYLSHGIQSQDVMIASVAVRLKVPLYTRNSRHFNMLPDLTVLQPY